MKFTKIVLMLCFSLIPFLKANASNGGIVGNGAGLVEQNIQYAMVALGKTLEHCIANPTLCRLDDSDVSLLVEINQIQKQIYTNPGKIVVQSEKANPGFFTTGVSEEHRIAKTELYANAVIYLNSDLFYTAEGVPRLDFAAITAILVHELGHQTGETNHARLDVLGAKLRDVVAQKSVSYTYTFPVEGFTSTIDVNIINYGLPVAMADLYISWDGNASVKLTNKILKNLSCGNNGTPVGYEVSNGHFFLTAKAEEYSYEQLIGFSAWISTFCLYEQSLRREVSELQLLLSGRNQAAVVSIKQPSVEP